MNSILKRVNVVFFLFLMLAQFGCIPAKGTSDVPCLEPTAWTNEFDFLIRKDGDNFLITAQTFEQGSDDFDDDGVIGNGEHESVYSFDDSSGTFTLVEKSRWEETDGEVASCRGGGGGILFGSYVVDGQAIPVRGGAVQVSGLRNVVAILSTEGLVPFPSLPFVSSGQHYSQFFSAPDFSPLSEPVRVGVGGAIISACWTVEGRFVIYHQRTSATEEEESGLDVLCFVENMTEIIFEAEGASP